MGCTHIAIHRLYMHYFTSTFVKMISAFISITKDTDYKISTFVLLLWLYGMAMAFTAAFKCFANLYG